MGSGPILDAFVLSLLAGAGATGLGATPASLLHGIGPRMRAVLGGLAAGIMLAATFFSLLAPGLERAIEAHGRWGGLGAATGSFALGAALVALLHRFSPHEHFIKAPRAPIEPGSRAPGSS